MTYEEYEARCETIEAENETLLDLFEEDLKSLSTKTIRQHRNNLCFFLNDYLLYEEPLTFDAGPGRVDDYLGYFFIRKFAWATPASIRRNAASIKKFYKSMVNHGKIAEADYKILCKTIKYQMPEWLADCEQYNDPDRPGPF